MNDVPKILRTSTMVMREYLECIPTVSLSDDAKSKIIKDLKYGQRVFPLVDIASHGLPTVATQLRSQKILDPETDKNIHSEINALKKLMMLPTEDSNNLKFLFVNATEFGGGVAEMRPNNSRFMKEFSVDGEWAVIDGCADFYSTTVHIHEGIQNPEYEPITQRDMDILQIVIVNNFHRLVSTNILKSQNAIWIDDPQPLLLIPLIRAMYPSMIVLWRCHIHCDPEPSIRDYVASIIEGKLDKTRDSILIAFMKEKYNIDLNIYSREQLRVHGAVFHREEFAEGLNLSKNINIIIMGPAIDPLSFKNMPVSQDFIFDTLAKYGIVKGKVTDEAAQIGENGCSKFDENGVCSKKIQPIVLEVSRYDPYKGPFEILVSFIEAIKSLDSSKKLEKDIMDEARFVFAASTPGDNPFGIKLHEMMMSFLSLLPLPEELEDLRKRVFLLSLRDQRRTEVLQKTLVDEIWECIRHKDELMIQDVLIRNHSLPLEKLISKLSDPMSGPLITKEMADYLRSKGDELIKANVCAYFTREQTKSATQFIKNSDFLEASIWIKVANNLLSGKEINHLEVNAMQTGALVRCQFSSKEGFGLVVSEAMVKEEMCEPKVAGLMVATTVGGVKSQVAPEFSTPVNYPNEEVRASLKMYRELDQESMKSKEGVKKLYNEISARKSVRDFASAIKKSLLMSSEEREKSNKRARNHILKNFSIHSNVLNILKAIRSAFEYKIK